MAYWGNEEKCTYLKLRCLHDDQDYCSAMVCTSQIKNHVVGGVYFVKDHGDYHFILDPLKDGKIKAGKLSIRFEIGGHTDNVYIPEAVSFGSCFDIKTDSVDIRINPMYCTFDNEAVSISTGKDESTCWVDFVLYEGEEKTFDFNSMKNTAFVFGLSVFDKEICINDGSSYGYEMNFLKKTIRGELLGAGEPASIDIPLNPFEYITNSAAGQVKKVKCGGFIYEENSK